MQQDCSVCCVYVMRMLKMSTIWSEKVSTVHTVKMQIQPKLRLATEQVSVTSRKARLTTPTAALHCCVNAKCVVLPCVSSVPHVNSR